MKLDKPPGFTHQGSSPHADVPGADVQPVQAPERPLTERRRRRRILDEETILDAALALIDDKGELTMAALAAKVGSTASSLYHHFSGRKAIIEALRDRLGKQVPLANEHGDWAEELVRMTRSYRDTFAAHPRIIPILTAQTISAEVTATAYEHMVGLLAAAGFPLSERLLWISVLDNFVLGSALDVAAPEDVWRRTGYGTPRLDAAVAAAPTGSQRADAAFELGIAALLTGMRARLNEVRGPF